MITHDAGKNFASEEFRQHAASMTIQKKEKPVESHNSVGLIGRYHSPLCRTYEIIAQETKGIDKESILRMATKAINDTAGPDSVVQTLLVFGAYPRITHKDPPAPSILQRAGAIKLAIKEVRRCYANRLVKEALRTRNGPSVSTVHELHLNSKVLFWREKESWTGPFRLLHI